MEKPKSAALNKSAKSQSAFVERASENVSTQSKYRINTGSIACLYSNEKNTQKYILTANHNLNAIANYVYLGENKLDIKLEVYRCNTVLDYAILKVDPTDLSKPTDYDLFINGFIPLQKSESVRSCEKHYIPSYKGIIADIKLCGEEVLSDDVTNNIRLSVTGGSGYSGSAVISKENKIIGIYLGQYTAEKRLKCDEKSSEEIKINEPGRALSMKYIDDKDLKIC